MARLKSWKRIFRFLYLKLFRINDNPQKIAFGLGMGVFSGIIPGTGPIFALFLAFIFQANRAAALLGSLLTNTWLSIVIFPLSIKLGSMTMQVNWQDVYVNWKLFLKNFYWPDLFKLSVLKLIFPVITGYFLVSFCLGTIVYFIALTILSITKRRRI